MSAGTVEFFNLLLETQLTAHENRDLVTYAATLTLAHQGRCVPY